MYKRDVQVVYIMMIRESGDCARKDRRTRKRVPDFVFFRHHHITITSVNVIAIIIIIIITIISQRTWRRM